MAKSDVAALRASGFRIPPANAITQGDALAFAAPNALPGHPAPAGGPVPCIFARVGKCDPHCVICSEGACSSYRPTHS
jgi:hypothetical protein